MNGQAVLFIIAGIIMIGSAVLVVTLRNLFHACLALMLSFLGVAGIYISLDAGFMAAAQLLVYIGAISILVIFAIMMTRRLMQTQEDSFNSQTWGSLAASVGVMAVMTFVTIRYWPNSSDATVPYASLPAVSDAVANDSVAALGRAFVSSNSYVLPFEIVSIMLLAALVGAILVAWPHEEDPA